MSSQNQQSPSGSNVTASSPGVEDSTNPQKKKTSIGAPPENGDLVMSGSPSTPPAPGGQVELGTENEQADTDDNPEAEGDTNKDKDEPSNKLPEDNRDIMNWRAVFRMFLEFTALVVAKRLYAISQVIRPISKWLDKKCNEKQAELDDQLAALKGKEEEAVQDLEELRDEEQKNLDETNNQLKQAENELATAQQNNAPQHEINDLRTKSDEFSKKAQQQQSQVKTLNDNVNQVKNNYQQAREKLESKGGYRAWKLARNAVQGLVFAFSAPELIGRQSESYPTLPGETFKESWNHLRHGDVHGPDPADSPSTAPAADNTASQESAADSKSSTHAFNRNRDEAPGLSPTPEQRAAASPAPSPAASATPSPSSSAGPRPGPS